MKILPVNVQKERIRTLVSMISKSMKILPQPIDEFINREKLAENVIEEGDIYEDALDEEGEQNVELDIDTRANLEKERQRTLVSMKSKSTKIFPVSIKQRKLVLQ